MPTAARTTRLIPPPPSQVRIAGSRLQLETNDADARGLAKFAARQSAAANSVAQQDPLSLDGGNQRENTTSEAGPAKIDLAAVTGNGDLNQSVRIVGGGCIDHQLIYSGEL